METSFTPFLSLAGGALIGLAAVMLMAFNGRIAGVSGIVSRILPPNAERNGRAEGIAFILGLFVAVPLWWLFTKAPPALEITTNLPLLIVAGLLVGFGSAFGSGCTSGHGVCGISRLSFRSLVATATFMLTALVAVYLLRHVVGG